MGRYRLRLSDDEFWTLTPAQFHALSEQARYEKEWLDFRAGLVCSTLANIYRAKNQKAFTPQDFMPGVKESENARQTQTWQEQLALVRQLNESLGGKAKGSEDADQHR